MGAWSVRRGKHAHQVTLAGPLDEVIADGGIAATKMAIAYRRSYIDQPGVVCYEFILGPAKLEASVEVVDGASHRK